MIAVTVLLAASTLAIAFGRKKLHGRLNVVFFTLTMATVAGFELLLQFVDVKATFDPESLAALRIHLCFAIPSAILLPAMLYTGMTGRRSFHLAVAVLFGTAWIGTFVTGVFFLPSN